MEPWRRRALESLAETIRVTPEANIRRVDDPHATRLLPLAEYVKSPAGISQSDRTLANSLIWIAVPPKLRHSIQSEVQLWRAVDAAFGLHRLPNETFEQAVKRCVDATAAMSAPERRRGRSRVKRKHIGSPAVQRQQVAAATSNASGHVKTTRGERDAFYASWEWRTLRMKVLKKHGRRCQCCGATPDMTDESGRPVRIVVDHIKPISKHWHLRLDEANLQIACDVCNMGKGAWDETDWRSDSPTP